jgi:hypothetical protein
MATPGTSIGERSELLPALSNAELGAIWADTVRSYAARRSGSARDFWRKLLVEPDVLVLHQEFRRRAMERQEEYDAWCQLAEVRRL